MKEVGESLEENSREVASVEITDKNVDVLTEYYLEYEVQKNDTLMLVAFKIYGDYRKWKDIKDWNENVVLGNKSRPAQKFTTSQQITNLLFPKVRPISFQEMRH